MLSCSGVLGAGSQLYDWAKPNSLGIGAAISVLAGLVLIGCTFWLLLREA